ncbi:hypothetical protein [Microbacterium sp.]|uniref:hypothetical protein n=1 Tax=Microbacterium sp. TaxID=51671 RepID=UPI003A8B1B29
MSQVSQRLRVARRVFVWAVIVSFALAALLGVIVLISGEMDDTAGRVLGTTTCVGFFSVAALCCVGVLSAPARAVGGAGIAVAAATAVGVIVLIWDGADGESFVNALLSGVVLTAALTVSSLLLLVAPIPVRRVRIALTVTLVLIAIASALLLWSVWDDIGGSEVLQRTIGVALILATLGIVVVPVLALLLRVSSSPVSAELAARLGRTARRRGVSVEELVAPLLDEPVGGEAASGQ